MTFDPYTGKLIQPTITFSMAPPEEYTFDPELYAMLHESKIFNAEQEIERLQRKCQHLEGQVIQARQYADDTVDRLRNEMLNLMAEMDAKIERAEDVNYRRGVEDGKKVQKLLHQEELDAVKIPSDRTRKYL